MKRALIFAGGSLNLEFAKQYTNHNVFDCLIAVDNGLSYMDQLGLKPDVIVGDFDTADHQLVDKYKDLNSIQTIELVPEKDETDTETAVDYAIRMGYEEVVLLGAMGGRFDHTLGNLHMLYRLLQHKIHGLMLDEKNQIYLKDSSFTLKKETAFGTYVSLIPFTPTVEKLSLQGFKYPLHEFLLQSGVSIGISNEIKDDNCEITFEKGILIIIEAQD
ncbi:MAG: thiamine diphosphokinase [Clostridiales bacterium]|nr:thiamine diphosphokinase [Clostridiales bacterium]